MEYFDFEGASSAHGSVQQEDDVASVDIELDEAEEQAANFNAIAQDQPLEFSMDPVPEQSEMDIGETVDPDGGYPMFRAQEPCDFCRRMGLDCFLAKRGILNYGCTCCISLYRECSFTHAKPTGKFLQTLHSVSENAYVPTGSLTGKKALKSVSYNTYPDDSSSRSQKSGARLSRKAISILKGWMRDHNENPYPTEQDKDDLKEETGLTRTQISNWFANARRRGKSRSSSDSSSPGTAAVDIPKKQSVDVSLMTPLERWKYSPPENEPATISDITRALANPPFDPSRPRRTPSGHVRPRRPGSSTNESSHASSEHKLRTASASSLDTSRSSLSDLSFASAFSHRSSLSFGSMDRKERRRRRKASVPANTLAHSKAKAARPFQCTFCTDSFPAKYDWQRHEKSMHLILDKWTCSPHGGAIEQNGIPLCVFCLAANPDAEHLETHNFISCQEKTVQERTFYRKDHLNQHLRLMHNAKFQSCMEQWQSSITEIKSRCGFCGSIFQTWKDRVDHLAAHFKNGASMAQWQGDWGFDPLIQARVENAIPPYMIDYEWRSPDPWATEQAKGDGGDGSSLSLPVPTDINCYHRLSRELTTYIHSQKAQGIVPSDSMIQAEARRVIYGCDDPWNQTCADNIVWLNVLKRDCGLQTAVNNEDIQFADLGMQPPFAVNGGLRAAPREINVLARTVCHGAPLHSPAVSSPSLRSSAFPGTGFSSAGPSRPGSLSGSYAGSAGMITAGADPSFFPDWASSLPTTDSAPGERPPDPLVQMGFDPEFLQRLNDSYDEINPDGLEGLHIEGVDRQKGVETQEWPKSSLLDQPIPQHLMGEVPASDLVSIFHSKEDHPPASDAAQRDMPRFFHNSGNF
jgi:hypothetical protein